MGRVRKGFTLVELIVVITILAILGTIGFLSLIGFQNSAREVTRSRDVNTLAKTLDLFYTQESYYPNPSDSFSVSFSGSLVWTQGTFGVDTQKATRRINQIPVDPLTGNEYAYSVINTRQEYELGFINESLLSQSSPFLFSQAHAANDYYANVKGNYNKQIVTVTDNLNLYILGAPTIITSETTDITIQDIFSDQSFATRNKQNLAGSYAGSLPEGQTHTGSTSFTPGSIISTLPYLLYSGTTIDLSTSGGKQLFGENLKKYYKDSNISSDYEVLGSIINGGEVVYVNSLILGGYGGLDREEISLSEETDFVLSGEDFSPDDISGIKLWIDASDLSTVTESGGLVSQINDKSGNNYHLSQASSVSQPKIGTRTMNSLDVLEFDGNQFLTRNDGLGFTGNPTIQTFVVTKVEGLGQSTGLFGVGVNEGSTLLMRPDTKGWSYRYFDGNKIFGSVVKNMNYITFWDKDIGDTYDDPIVYLNGGMPEVGSSSTNSTYTTNLLNDGTFLGGYSSGREFDGIIAEVIVYDTKLLDLEVNQVGNYLADKWGVIWSDI